MNTARPYRSGGTMVTVPEEDCSSKASSSTTSKNKVSKVASLKKKFGFFSRRKSSSSSDGGDGSRPHYTRTSSINSGSSVGEGDGYASTGSVGRRNSSMSMSSEEDDILPVDKFGFVIENVVTTPENKHDEITQEGGTSANSSTAVNNTKSKRLRKRGDKYSKSVQAVVDEPPPTTGPSDMILMKKIARLGLPDHRMRNRAWIVITGIDTIMLKREGEYDALVGKSRVDKKQIQECLMGGQHRTEWGVIERDLRRTFPNHYLFKEIDETEATSGDVSPQEKSDGEFGDSFGALTGLLSTNNKEEGYGKKALRRILRAYSVYDNEVGYCQGMNFVAAMFLTFLPEEESFWMLAVVMNEEPYKLRDLFTKDMTGTHEVLYIADKLVSQFLPALYEHLENEQVHISMFVTQWLMTVYTSTFPFELVSRVWDLFLCDGWIVVYRVMLALLQNVQQELLERNLEQILSYLRKYPPQVKSERIIALSSEIPLKQHHIQAHISEFRALIESGEIQVEEILHSRFAIPASIDGHSLASSRATLSNINKVHRFVAKLKRSVREISHEDLSVKLVPVAGKPMYAVLLSNVLSPEECAGLIKRAKGEQFEDVLMRRPVPGPDGSRDIASLRRSMLEDLDLASELFDRIARALQGTDLGVKLQHAPWITGGDETSLNATGLNDRLHILRFGNGQFFAPHRDSRFKRDSEVSHITMQVYLNHNFKGGRTSFRGGTKFLDVKPKTGSVLLFDQDLRREECEVLGGRKFVLRSDVMFEHATIKE